MEIEQIKEEVNELRDQVNSQEQIIAQLTMAYAEVWMIVEALTQLCSAGQSEEQMKEFWKNLAEVRVEMYKEMSKAGGDPNVDPTSSDFAAAVEHLVTGKPADTTD